MGKSHRRLERERGTRKMPNESFLDYQNRVRKTKKVKKSATPADPMSLQDNS